MAALPRWSVQVALCSFPFASFARTAPAATILVIKEHPLDNGLKDWRTEMQRCARRFGVEDRFPAFDVELGVKADWDQPRTGAARN